MHIEVDGPITLTPAAEPESEQANGLAPMLVFIVALVVIGLLLRFW